MGLGHWGELGAWITRRVDQVSNYIKKKKRISDVNKIDKIINSHDDAAFSDILRDIEKKHNDRQNAS